MQELFNKLMSIDKALLQIKEELPHTRENLSVHEALSNSLFSLSKCIDSLMGGK